MLSVEPLREKKRKYDRLRYWANREVLLKKSRDRARKVRKESPEKVRKKLYSWRSKNPAKTYLIKRRSLVKRKYGLTLEQVEQMRSTQKGVCRICLQQKPLCVDHCHKTGRVRGLLCNRCNRAIGLLNDDFSTLIRAANHVGWVN